MHKQTTKITAFTAQQDGHFAAKEKQRTLRLQAAQAQFARQKQASEVQPEAEIAIAVDLK